MNNDRPTEARPATETMAMIRRAGMLLAFMLFWAFAATPHDPQRTVAVMAFAVAIFDGVIAGLRAQKLMSGTVNYWDSAAAFMTVHLAARALA